MYGVIYYQILEEFNINHIDYLVAYHIMVMSKNGGFCSKSIPTIAKDIKTSKDTVKRALKKIDNKLVVNLGSNTRPMRIVTVNFLDSVKSCKTSSGQNAPMNEVNLHPPRGQNAPMGEGKMHSLKVIKVNKSNKESSVEKIPPTPVPNFNETKKGILKNYLKNCDPKIWQDAFKAAKKIPPTTKQLVEEVEQWEARCENRANKKWILKTEVVVQWRDFKTNWIPFYNSRKSNPSPTAEVLPRVFDESMYTGEYNQKFYNRVKNS